MNGRPEIFSAEELLKYLPATGLTTGEWRRKVCIKTKMSRNTFLVKMEELRAHKKVKTIQAEPHKFGTTIKSVLNVPVSKF